MKRNIVLCIILSIITFGIYGIYWICVLQDETLEKANETGPSGIVVILLTLITCGIYGIYWSYKLGERCDKIKKQNGSYGIIFLLLCIFGLTIVNYALAQDTLNNAQ